MKSKELRFVSALFLFVPASILTLDISFMFQLAVDIITAHKFGPCNKGLKQI